MNLMVRSLSSLCNLLRHKQNHTGESRRSKNESVSDSDCTPGLSIYINEKTRLQHSLVPLKKFKTTEETGAKEIIGVILIRIGLE